MHEGVLSAGQWRALADLWREAIAWDATDVEGAVLHVLGALAGLVEAPQGFASFALRLGDDPDDALLGWRPGPTLQFGYSEAQTQRVQAFERGRQYLDDPFLAQMARGCGRKRVAIQSDVTGHAPSEAPTAKLLRQIGGTDRMVAAWPVAADLEVLIGFNRGAGSPHFGEAERSLLLEASSGLEDLCRRFALSHGLVAASRPLRPREREVALHLLSGESEKEVAARLGLASSSLHQYVVAVYRKFGVASRAQFMSLWLTRGRR